MTRPRGTDEGRDPLVRALLEVGLRAVRHPLLRIAGPVDRDGLDEAVRPLLRGAGEAWVLLTSRNAVTPFGEALRRVGGSPDALRAGVRIGAVGPGTAAVLRAAGFRVDLVPREYTAEGLLAALRGARRVGDARALEGTEILLPRGDRGRDALPRGLRRLGARVREVTAYRTLVDREGGRALREAVARGEVDGVALTSGSAAEALAGAFEGGFPPRVLLAAIGPVTGSAARARGLRVDVVAEPSTFEALAEGIRAATR